MTTSDTAKRQRRTVGLTIGLLAVVTVILALACVAIGEEILTLPENRREAADIAARLPGLRQERNSLIAKIAERKAELADLEMKAERASTIAKKLPNLQAEETRTRGARDRLAKEVAALNSDIGMLKTRGDQLTGSIKSYKDEINDLSKRSEAERKRRDEVRKELSVVLQNLAQTKGAHAAQKQKLLQDESDAASTGRLLESIRAELKGLTAEAQGIRNEIARLKEEKDELKRGNQRQTTRLANLQGEIQTIRTTLATVQEKRDRTRDELIRAEAKLTTVKTREEAASARLQDLIGLEAKARQRIRAMIDELNDAQRTNEGTETSR